MLMQDRGGPTCYGKFLSFLEKFCHLFANCSNMNNIEPIVETMQCVVCYSFPRTKIAYTCLECGHMVCQVCGDQIQAGESAMCPMCRSPRLVITKYMERLLSVMREMTTVSCQFDINGCRVVKLASNIERHEERCGKRNVSCPAGHWEGGCPWLGIWEGALLDHMREMKCLQSFRVVKSGETLRSQVLDTVESSNVDARGIRHWKPFFVVIKIDDRNEGLYLNISRAPNGLWTLMPRCYAPSYVRSRIGITLCISSAREGGETLSPRGIVSYSGPVISHHLSNASAVDSGHSLFLTDAQVKFMKTEKVLFNYSLTLMLQ